MKPSVPSRHPTGADPDDDWAARLPWHEDARDAGEATLRRHAVELRNEAERIARRKGAATVSKTFVHEAGTHLGLSTPSGGSDVLLGIGGLLLGIAGGFGAALLLTPTAVTTALTIISVIVVVLGTAAFAVGATLKMRQR